MKPLILLAAIALALPLAAPAKSGDKMAPQKIPPYITKAVHDPARKADMSDDSRRKIAHVMAFTEVKPGDTVVELVPGSGYWTRVFSQVVGPQGHVYTIWPQEMGRYEKTSIAEWKKLAKTKHYGNVSVLEQPAAELSVPGSADLVFTVQNYHDYHDPFMGPVDMAKFNKEVFDTLKPGGLFVVVDHVAPARSGLKDTNTLHRIDPAVVKREVENAGFKFDGESDALRNPEDPHTITVFDKKIRGRTDQFIYRFRKPAK